MTAFQAENPPLLLGILAVADTAEAWQVVCANTKNEENSMCLFLDEERKALILSSHASADGGCDL